MKRARTLNKLCHTFTYKRHALAVGVRADGADLRAEFLCASDDVNGEDAGCEVGEGGPLHEGCYLCAFVITNY
jgi:hypothetical protein